MWELDYKETWLLKNWCFWTVLLEKTLESPLDYREIQPVHPKGNQSWIFIGRTDAEAETPILWPPGAKNWLTGKDPDVGKDWRWEEKGTREDEMVGWHHWLNRHEFESTLGVGDGQEGLVCCIPWGLKELDTTEWLNWTVWQPTGFLLPQTLHIPSCLRALACTEHVTQSFVNFSTAGLLAEMSSWVRGISLEESGSVLVLQGQRPWGRRYNRVYQ